MSCTMTPDAGKKWVEASPSIGGGGGDSQETLQSVTDRGNVTNNGATFGGS